LTTFWAVQEVTNILAPPRRVSGSVGHLEPTRACMRSCLVDINFVRNFDRRAVFMPQNTHTNMNTER